MCDYNPKCFMSGGFILDDIITGIFSETVDQEMNSVIDKYFPKERMMGFTCTKDLFSIIHGRKQLLIKIRHYFPIIS